MRPLTRSQAIIADRQVAFQPLAFLRLHVSPLEPFRTHLTLCVGDTMYRLQIKLLSVGFKGI